MISRILLLFKKMKAVIAVAAKRNQSACEMIHSFCQKERITEHNHNDAPFKTSCRQYRSLIAHFLFQPFPRQCFFKILRKYFYKML